MNLPDILIRRTRKFYWLMTAFLLMTGIFVGIISYIQFNTWYESYYAWYNKNVAETGIAPIHLFRWYRITSPLVNAYDDRDLYDLIRERRMSKKRLEKFQTLMEAQAASESAKTATKSATIKPTIIKASVNTDDFMNWVDAIGYKESKNGQFKCAEGVKCLHEVCAAQGKVNHWGWGQYFDHCFENEAVGKNQVYMTLQKWLNTCGNMECALFIYNQGYEAYKKVKDTFVTSAYAEDVKRIHASMK